ncbi:MAG: FAD-dependent oxidoreductase [Deltaproteobacteria bacterium]|nr:FAD-dependent oxidoreductase [Deltaproteobacteria bacterium]
MSRSRALSLLRRGLATSLFAAKKGMTPSDAAAELNAIRVSRREALALAAAAAVPFACGDDPVEPPANTRYGADVRVAVVGAGAAGLMCGYRLTNYGFKPKVFDAATRVGGRMFTTNSGLSDGQVAELGGELVDTNHILLRALVDELGLTLDDLFANEPAGYRRDTFWFGGRLVPESEIVEKFSPLAAKMQAELSAAETDEAKFATLDDMGMKAWLDAQTDVDPLIKDIIAVAYLDEYGLEIDQQSVFNLLYLIDFETADPFRVYGDSDERFHIHGGNEQVPKALAAALSSGVELEQRLVRVKSLASGTVELTFDKGGTAKSEEFDRAILALPFTLLRDVEFQFELPADQRQAIDELGYGTNAKLMAQFTSRVWHDTHNASGSTITDNGLQELWDTARGQPGTSGLLTNFVGGQEGVAMGEKTPEEQVSDRLARIDAIFPGAAAAYRPNTALRMHWPSAPFAKGSYACYKPGQWAFAGVEGKQVGALHFAGEHTSIDFQGYMEGAIETGQRAADEIQRDLADPGSALRAAPRSRGSLRKLRRKARRAH